MDTPIHLRPAGPADDGCDAPRCGICRARLATPEERRARLEAHERPPCAPRLLLFDAHGHEHGGEAAVGASLEVIRGGGIVAVKGSGGFQLVCDALAPRAVAALRARKPHATKPLAVMVADIDVIAPYAQVTAEEAELLRSAGRPIVLARKKAACDALLAGVAPRMAALGVMLPPTPVHELLARAPCHGCERVLAITSANRGGEPPVSGVAEAFARLAGIADAWLVTDCEIAGGDDDSVAFVGVQGPTFLRLGRGHAPAAIPLACDGEPVLACGGDRHNAPCVTRGAEAFLGGHVGDLEVAATRAALAKRVERMVAELGVTPACVAYDPHAQPHARAFARAWARSRHVPAVGVTHEHAHVAAICAEHRVTWPVLGLVLDDDCAALSGGGELLHVDGASYARVGRLMDPPLSAGLRARRLIDGAAALLGTTAGNAFDGQGAMELEALAARHGEGRALRGGFVLTPEGILDLRPLAYALAHERDRAHGAALFHDTLGEALARWAADAAQRDGLDTVVLAGGAFASRRLCALVLGRLRAAGFDVLVASAAPLNDGGLALGQAWVAMLAIREAQSEPAPA